MAKTVQLASWGNSTALRIPKSILNQLGLNETSVVSVTASGDEIIVKACRTHIPLAERFAGYTGDYAGEELDWGPDVGEEICD